MSKETHFIDTEVEQLPTTSWDDYETYCTNEERVFEAIVDEASLYKIASEAVKKKLDSLNTCAKNFEQYYLNSLSKIDELNNTIRKLKEELAEVNKNVETAKLEASKEFYEDYLRAQNPLGVVAGDKFYTIKSNYEDVECPYCGGTGKIITQTGKEIGCYKCVKGKVSERVGYEIEEQICDKVNSYKQYDGSIIYKYYASRKVVDHGYTETKTDCFEFYETDCFLHTKAFPTKEKAEEYIKELKE